MLQTATAHAVDLDGEILSPASSFYMENSQENTAEECDTSGNGEWGGVCLYTGDVDGFVPSLWA